jgi:hypothetical protein
MRDFYHMNLFLRFLIKILAFYHSNFYIISINLSIVIPITLNKIQGVTTMSRTYTAQRTSKRVVAVVITVLLAVITNIAISYASGISTYTVPPRPTMKSFEQHSGISTYTVPPRPVGKNLEQRSGISTYTVPPRPVGNSLDQHSGISTYTVPPRPTM